MAAWIPMLLRFSVHRFGLVCLALMMGALATSARSQGTECPEPKSSAGQRYIVVISDLHFGQGYISPGHWHPQEDFRWSKALQGFLDRISTCSNETVDLVIAGDLLELWQPPAALACKSRGDELGCTPKELEAIASFVVAAHADDLAALGRFADRGANFLHIVPGNHDAGLMISGTWSIVEAAIGSAKGRVKRVNDGIWVGGTDGAVVIEHGHQIGSDVNGYGKWPEITRSYLGKEYVLRPWGERFVQRLFNDQETLYPVIDNLSPESAGARYRMADRGLWKSVSDVARFIAFNAYETSPTQLSQALGQPESTGEWDVYVGRAMGHRLFALSLASEDPFRKTLLGKSTEAGKLRKELDALARDPMRLPDGEVKLLCAQLALRTKNEVVCRVRMAGALVQGLVSTREAVLAGHLRERMKKQELSQMRVFVYGHTHQLEEASIVAVTDLRRVTVLNTGAFQRVVDEPGFLSIAAKKGWTAPEALRNMSAKDLPACYSAVVVAMGAPIPEARTVLWNMEEGQQGRFLDVGENPCPKIRLGAHP